MKTILENLKWLYYHKNKVVMFLSEYNDFKQLTSTQKILDELLKNYNEKFLEKMWLNTFQKIKNFLIKNNVEVVDVIACFKYNDKSRPIAHYPHTFLKDAMDVIEEHLKNWDNSLYDNSKLESLITWNKITNIIDEDDKIKKEWKRNKLNKLEQVYEDMNSKNNQVELEKEIEYIDRIKSRFAFEKNKENIPSNTQRIHNKWKEEIHKKNATSCNQLANIFKIIDDNKVSKNLIVT